MARMPGAVWVGEQSDGSTMHRYDVICIHTIVGFAPAPAAHFSTTADGTIFQSRDTNFQSRANVQGNHRVIAVENEDMGPPYGEWNRDDGHAVPDFTEEQVEAIAQICAWAAMTHDIPLEPCLDSRPSSRGIAFHRQGISGNFLTGGYAFDGIVAGGERWTKFSGKVCPGDRRIATLLERIIPRAVEIATGAPSSDVPTATAEAADMLVGQDASTGQIWLVSGNTKLQLPVGGGTASGDGHSAGNTGHIFVDEILRTISEAYPGSDPKFVRLSHDILARMPEIHTLVDEDTA